MDQDKISKGKMSNVGSFYVICGSFGIKLMHCCIMKQKGMMSVSKEIITDADGEVK